MSHSVIYRPTADGLHWYVTEFLGVPQWTAERPKALRLPNSEAYVTQAALRERGFFVTAMSCNEEEGS